MKGGLHGVSLPESTGEWSLIRIDHVDRSATPSLLGWVVASYHHLLHHHYHHHHHHHLSLNHEGRWGTTDDFHNQFLPFFPVPHRF